MPDAAFVTPPLEIEPSFLDYNGHVNMAYHLVLADRALELAFERFKGGPAYVAERGMTTFAAELHVRYLKEIAMGDEIRGRVTMLASDEKRVMWAVELIGGDGAVGTTVEGVSLSVSTASRRVEPFPDDVARVIERDVEADAASASALVWRGRRVTLDGAQ